MTAAVIVIVLAVLGLAFVVLPLRRGPSFEVDGAPTPVEEARERKNAALAGIVDVEQEHESGKMSSEDFRSLRTEYERDAIAALNELDVLAASTRDDDLEREIAEVRQQLACPSCGAPRGAGKPCPRCGA